MGAWPYPPWLVSCNKRSVLIPERTTLQSNSIQTYKHVPIVNFSPMLIMMTMIKIPSLSLAMIMTIMTMIKILMYWWPSQMHGLWMLHKLIKIVDNFRHLQNLCDILVKKYWPLVMSLCYCIIPLKYSVLVQIYMIIIIDP